MAVEDLRPEHKKILAASEKIETFKNYFPETEFYSFDESLKQGGPVIKYFNVLGISGLADLEEHRNNKSISNKLARLGEYINCIEPLMVKSKLNPVRRYFRLKDLEFNDDKFYLTRDEAERFNEFLADEKQKIKSMTGIEFNTEIKYSGSTWLSTDEVDTLIQKAAGMNVWMKALIWEYIESYSDATRAEKKRFFNSMLCRYYTNV